MRHAHKLMAGALALACSAASSAHAQFYPGSGVGGYGYGYGRMYGGYGGFGGGGWATSALGDEERGLGAEAAGFGQLHEENAIAGSINTNTVMRWNQYLYNSQVEAQRRYHAFEQRRLGLDKAHYEERKARILNNPTNDDIDSGNALNAVLDQLSDPAMLNGSSLRLANGTLSPEVIKDIPFHDSTDAITLSLDQMTDKAQWPMPLRSDLFKTEREAYENAIDEALKEDEGDGTLKPETVAKVRAAVAALKRKVDLNIPKTNKDHILASKYITGLAGMSKMLEKPNVDKLLSELEHVKTTSVGNLIAFMHAYNLRFAPAETAKQRAVYHDLYPLMTQSRDKVMGNNASNNGAQANNNKPSINGNAPADNSTKDEDHPTTLFRGFKDTHLYPSNN